MIQKILPLTENKLRILTFIYEKKETHLLQIAKNLKIHPYSLQKTLKSLKPVIEEKKAGKTILLKLDRKTSGYYDLITIIEDYRLKTENRILKMVIKIIQEQFDDGNIICCLVFGSYARNASNEKSDIDLLFVAKKKEKGINRRISQLSTLLNKEISPLLFNEREFEEALQIKEPAIATITEPSQRLIVIGKEWFIKKTAI